MVDPRLWTRPVGPNELMELATLFNDSRNTRRCWCMAPCVTGARFAVGWLTGLNRRWFEAGAASSTHPMGILASVSDVPVGWCACGPRSRYITSPDGRLLGGRDRLEDDAVWLVPCFLVRPKHRGQGVTHTLLRSAVQLATVANATAIEGWPAAQTEHATGDGFLGREGLFAELGFRCVARPDPKRTLMRLELAQRS